MWIGGRQEGGEEQTWLVTANSKIPKRAKRNAIHIEPVASAQVNGQYSDFSTAIQ